MAANQPSGPVEFCRSFPSVLTALQSVVLLVAMPFGCTKLAVTDRPALSSEDESVRTEPYRWRNVAIGGGGYVTGLVVHPKVPDQIYLRTDVGGIYKWDRLANAWSAITDSFAREDWHLYGVESLALHPDDPQTLYAALGKYLPRQWLRKPSASQWVATKTFVGRASVLPSIPTIPRLYYSARVVRVFGAAPMAENTFRGSIPFPRSVLQRLV